MKAWWMALGLLVLIPTCSAQPWGWHHGYYAVQPWGWHYGWWYYNTTTNVNVTETAKAILSNAQVEPITCFCGFTRYVIVSNGVAVGWLWENVDLSKVTFGEPIMTPWFVKVPLIYNGYVVGILNVPLIYQP